MNERIRIFLLLLCGSSSTVTGDVFRRQIPGSNFTLGFEWSDMGLPLTEGDYYSMAPAYAEDYVNAVGSRPGHSTNTHSCDRVRSVPPHLRSATHIRPSGLSYFYQKYTEAYNIPVLASRNVPDSALRRACYVLRFLLADHAGVRQSYYRLSGRVAVIGALEGTVSIPEHSWLGASWNARARGLGATEHAPVSTGGEENILCYNIDRYRNEDIFLHEFSHGIHLLGAKYAIPGWQRRLQSLYNQARFSGRWRNTYAMSTVEEYFAEGTQSYFDVNAYSSYPNGVHNHVNTREKLRDYDPQLYALIQEVFPCGNNYSKRCETNSVTSQEITNLTDKTFFHVINREMNQVLRMDCNPGGSGNRATTSAPTQPPVTQPPVTEPPVTEPPVTQLPVTQPPVTQPPVTQPPVTQPPVTQRPVTGTCRDYNTNCATWASRRECNSNPNYMHVYCKRSCNMCGGTGGGRQCVDSHTSCGYWLSIGECARNPVYMRRWCRRSCGQC